MNIKVVDESGEEAVEKPAGQPQEMSGALRLEEMEIANMFDLGDGEEADSVDTLLKWAKTQTDDHSTQSLKWAIRNLEAKTGTPPLGEKNVNFLSRYAYLALEGMKIDKELDNYKQRL